MSVHEDTATLFFRIEDHEIKLLRHLYLQTQEGKFYDVTLVAHGTEVRAHQAVLCAHSEYFETLFSGRWSNTAIHDLSHLFWSAETLKTVVRFMYTGNIEITKDTIEEILNIATHLLMGNLRGACAKYLLANLAPKNCMTIWQLGDQYNLLEVQEMCQAVAISRFRDYPLMREDMMEVDKVFMEKVIKCGLFDSLSKEEASSLLQAWQQNQQHQVDSLSILELLPMKYLPMSALDGMDISKVDATAPNTTEGTPECPEEAYSKDKTVEAIFGYVLHSKGARQPPSSFDVYMYLAEPNSWKFVDHFDDSHWSFLLQAEHVGVVGEEAVYDGGIKYRSALVDFKSKTFKTISFPYTNALSRNLFCFDSQVFLIEDLRCSDGKTIKHNVWILDRSSLTWENVLTFDVATMYPGFQASDLLAYTVICQTDNAFIWAQDQTSKCRGPYWMRFHKDPLSGSYALATLQTPPLGKDDLRLPSSLSMKGWKHAAFRLSAGFGKVYVYREKSLQDNSLALDILLTYTLETNTWTRKDQSAIALPNNDNLPIHSNAKAATNSTTFVQVDRYCRLQSVSHGRTYLMEKVCPFVTKMWAVHLGEGTWQQLSPPPVEDIEGFVRFSVVSMPEGLASQIGTPPVYQGISEDAPHSPMVDWELCLADVSSDIKLQTSFAQRIQQDVFSF